MKLIVVIFVWLLLAVNGAKILGIFPLPGPSHYILGSALMRALAERGHDVTIVSPFGEKNLPQNGNYRDIILTGSYEAMLAKLKKMNMFDREEVSPVSDTIFLTLMMMQFHEKALAHENVQKLINSNETFDVVIVEQFMNDAHKGFAAHFKAPLISLSTIGANFWTDPVVGNPSPTSYISDPLLNYPTAMSFWQRLCSSYFILFKYLFHYLYIFPQQNKIMKKYFPNSPELYDILYNSSIMLVNSHPSTNRAVPYVPTMIDIGGFHIQPPKKLPSDLQEYLDSAKDGIIYFSMGSNLKSAQLPTTKREALISAFAKLKQKVLWKWEDETLPNKPENVKLGKWLPQQDILAHPNVKLFISHCGLLSTTETVYHGVPVLAIPIFGDQKINAQFAIDNGFGLSLPYSELNEETLSKKLNQLLQNPKYALNAKERSMLFHDRPVKPIDLATYWVEYVARHRGAPHLRVAGLGLPWYQYHLLDVIAFSAGVTLFIFLFIFFAIKSICCKLCKKISVTEKKLT